MSKFYVGQRVRIIDPTSIHVGRLATIVMRRVDSYRTVVRTGVVEKHPVLWRIDIDGYGRYCAGGGHLTYAPSELEPIEGDDSRTLVSWDSIKSEDGRVIWQPGRVNERA